MNKAPDPTPSPDLDSRRSSEDDETLAELVARALEVADEDGDGTSIEWICRHRPDLRERVEAALKLAGRFPVLQQLAPGSEEAPRFRDRYEVEERIGSGAMGEVWLAYDARLERRVAIKVLSDSLEIGAASPERFEREARALAAVRHSAVVTVHDSGVSESGAPFLVMENVEGVPLADLLAAVWERVDAGRPDRLEALREVLRRMTGDSDGEVVLESTYERQAVRWMAQLAEGLEVAHDAGVIHRDVKPSNVMIRKNGDAVLVDFGIAFVEGQADLTATEASVGTPAYMAPEALDGKTSRGHGRHASGLDIWGLGATLYHAVAGRAPYVGTPSEVIRALATREPSPITDVAPDLPVDLRAILEHALERRPAKRYGSAVAMAQDLYAFLDHRPVSVRPIGRVGRLVRRARGSRALQGAVLSLVLVMGVLSLRSYRVAASHARALEGAASWAAVPANLTVTSPFLRSIALAEDREAMLAALDRVVASGVHPVAGRALRASLHLDFGDPGRAAADIADVARKVGTPYARGLSGAYEALKLEEGEVGAKDLQLEGLPDPQSAMDHYLYGYHELRQLRRESAREHLLIPELEAHRHARELAVLCASLEIDRHNKPSEKHLREIAAGKMLDEARRLEEDFDQRSAMSAALIATSLSVLRSWNLALDASKASIALSPYSVPALENAAMAAQKLRRHDDVDHFVKLGLRLIPDNAKLNERWIRSAGHSGLTEEALELVASCALRSTSQREYLTALVQINEAMQRWIAGDQAGTHVWAAQGLATCDAALRERKTSRMNALKLMAAGFMEGDTDSLFFGALQIQEKNEFSVQFLNFLCETFPKSLPVEAGPYLHRFLETVRSTVKHGDLAGMTE